MAKRTEYRIVRPDGYTYSARLSEDTVKVLRKGKLQVTEVKRREPANKGRKPDNKQEASASNKDSDEAPAKDAPKDKDSGKKA